MPEFKYPEERDSPEEELETLKLAVQAILEANKGDLAYQLRIVNGFLTDELPPGGADFLNQIKASLTQRTRDNVKALAKKGAGKSNSNYTN